MPLCCLPRSHTGGHCPVPAARRHPSCQHVHHSIVQGWAALQRRQRHLKAGWHALLVHEQQQVQHLGTCCCTACCAELALRPRLLRCIQEHAPGVHEWHQVPPVGCLECCWLCCTCRNSCRVNTSSLADAPLLLPHLLHHPAIQGLHLLSCLCWQHQQRQAGQRVQAVPVLAATTQRGPLRAWPCWRLSACWAGQQVQQQHRRARANIQAEGCLAAAATGAWVILQVSSTTSSSRLSLPLRCLPLLPLPTSTCTR
jgi:hypothetical protein